MANRRTTRIGRRLGFILLIGALGLGACGDDDDSGSPAAAEPAGDATTTTAAGTAVSAPANPNSITIKLIAFRPTELEVAAGTDVTWIQDDVASHTVTSGVVETLGGSATAKPDGKFDSGTIKPGENFAFTFREAGDFPFFCSVHPATMTGVVRVT